ncbi:MAG: helix-turn-helix transcriptional regulator [Acidobacteria bacterium]|nr:helix-turn-helix transcriptional regulator [Acidobacteriota bacterium]
MIPADDSCREALDRLAALDPDGARRAFDRWLIGAGSAEALLDALSRLDAVARRIERSAGIEDGARMLLAQRLSLSGSLAEMRAICRETVAGMLAAISGRPRLSAPVARARDFVTANFNRRISLREVADAAGLSPNYLSTKFREECGATLVRFVHALRVEAAARLLTEGNRRISEVASLVGYQNYRDFHRNFVRIRRAPPGAFLGAPPRGSAPRGGVSRPRS